MVSNTWRRLRPALLAATAVLALAACDTAEERAEKHFGSALSLFEKGDVPRGRVELQNVFKLNPQHREARTLMAKSLLDEGNIRDAYAQYTRLVEQYPDDVEGHIALGEMSIVLDNWEATEPHAKALSTLAPSNPRAQAIIYSRDYRNSVLDDDSELRRSIARKAEELVPALPDNVVLRAIIVDSYFLDKEFSKALLALDELQRLAPEDRRFHQMRLSIHTRTENQQGIEETLRSMVKIFPDDLVLAQTLVSFYHRIDNLDGAEEFLRSRITEGEPDKDPRIALVRFLAETGSLDRAIGQAEAFVEEGTNTPLFRALVATLRFDRGEQEAAIAELEDILSTAEPGSETNEIRVSLATILSATGNDVGARALIEEVLEADPSNVNALRVKAVWLIQDDDTDQAIILLRRALDQDPRNAQVLTIMAEAHLRNGERPIAAEMLAQAVEASNNAPAQSLDYARLLIGDQRYAAAESVLLNSLRMYADNLELYTELLRVLIAEEDWPRVGQVEATLRSIGTPRAIRLADRARVSLLRAQERDDEAIEYLQGLSDAQEGGDRAAVIAIVRTHLEQGDPVQALTYLDELIDEKPDDRNLHFLRGAVLASAGDLTGAESVYRQILEDTGGNERVYIELVRLLNAQNRFDESEAVVNEAVEQFPDAGDLLWMKASFAERANDYEAAIEIYEKLYETNSSVDVIANNLASLLSTTRTDEESLNRAWKVARRLRDSNFAPFQDTYGWIAFLRGDLDQAVAHLEPAAAGLPNDPLVQFHLGKAYEASNRLTDAQTVLTRAIQIAGDDPRPAFDEARTLLEAIETRGNTAPTADE